MTQGLKPVAVATPELPAVRLTKEAEKGSSQFGFWEKTPDQHFKDYLESTLPPGPHRKIRASGIARLAYIWDMLWLTAVPLVSFSCCNPTAASIEMCAFVYGNLWMYFAFFLQ
jgi:hypothetical protein